jgi:hypothetical protein
MKKTFMDGSRILLATACVLLSGCDEKLPEPTQTGAYTFGCKVNEKNWIADGRKGFMAPKAMEGGIYSVGYGSNQKLVIDIRAYKSNREIVEFYVASDKPGTYKLDNDTKKPASAPLDPGSYGGFSSAEADLSPEYVTSSKHTGEITITKVDRAADIISGTFHFTAVDVKGNLVEVTDGRFDFKRK